MNHKRINVKQSKKENYFKYTLLKYVKHYIELVIGIV
jgi:hypothetical protein